MEDLNFINLPVFDVNTRNQIVTENRLAIALFISVDDLYIDGDFPFHLHLPVDESCRIHHIILYF